MARPRKHASNAARQRDYRDRQRLRKIAAIKREVHTREVRHDGARRRALVAELDRLNAEDRRRLTTEDRRLREARRLTFHQGQAMADGRDPLSPDAQRDALRGIRTTAARHGLDEIEALAWKLLAPLWGKRFGTKKRP